MTANLTSTLTNRLRQRELPDGGFAERPDGELRSDATAWCILALSAIDPGNPGIALARQRLSRVQGEDGRVCIKNGPREAVWPTPLAALAWGAAPEYRQAQDRAVTFLLETSGQHWPRQSDAPVAHDTSIRGWPWVTGAHSWVEPTALAILALQASGHGGHPRTREALRMLLDRQLERGGWNYGNTRVYGQELRPMPDATGAALQALAGGGDLAMVARSLGYLESVVYSLRTPFSLAWGLLGLGAWGRRPAATENLIAAALENELRLGSYPTSHLCLLLLALAGRDGLNGLILPRKGADGG